MFIALGPVLASVTSISLFKLASADQLASQAAKVLNLSLLFYNLVGLTALLALQLPLQRKMVFAATAVVSAYSCVRGYKYNVKDVIADIKKLNKSITSGLFKWTDMTSAAYLLASWVLTVLSVRKLAEFILLLHAGDSKKAITRLVRLAKYNLAASFTFILKDTTPSERASSVPKILKRAVYVSLFAAALYLFEAKPCIRSSFAYLRSQDFVQFLLRWLSFSGAYPLL
jgi:hypothetical protein